MAGNRRMGFTMPLRRSTAEPDERHGNENNGGGKGLDGAAPTDEPDQSVCSRKGQGARKSGYQGHQGNGLFCPGPHDPDKDAKQAS